MHADERLRFEDQEAPANAAEIDDADTDRMLIGVLSATRTPAELEHLAKRLLRAAQKVRQG